MEDSFDIKEKSDRKLNLENLQALLNHLGNAAIYVIKRDTREVLYYNNKFESLAPQTKLGMICHELWEDKCERCPLKHMDGNDYYTEVRVGDITRELVDITANKIMWGDIPAYSLCIMPHIITDTERDIEFERYFLSVAIAQIYPMIILVNLTKNEYYMVEYDGFGTKKAPEKGNFDELIKIGTSTMHPTYMHEFYNTFNRQNLIEHFENGVKELYTEHLQLGDDGVYHWTSTHVLQLESFEDDHIWEITLSRNLDDKKKYEEEHALVSDLKDVYDDVNRLMAQEFKLNFALECAYSLNWEMSNDFKKIVFGKTFEKFIGINQADYDYNFEEFITIYLHPYKESILKAVEDYINGVTDCISTEISMYDIWGDLHWLLVRGKYINEKKEVIYGVSLDITEQKEYEKRLANMAYVDTLTGLYKIEYITDVMAGRIDDVKLNDIGVMVIDISKFSNINAVFGHEFGDGVLIYTANKLRFLAGYNLTVRIGSDEFMIIFNDVKDTKKIEEVANLIINDFNRQIMIMEHMCYINLKIGIAISNGARFEETFKDAEIALSQAKKDGTNRICVLNDVIKENSNNLIHMRYELRKAIDEKEFILYFQPIVSTDSKRLIGMEALIRWNHPQKGIVSPFYFIPLAEETGLINEIGDFVIEKSMKYLKQWLVKDSDIFVSINISVIQFMSPNLIERIQILMKAYSIPASSIVIEVTESVFISDTSHITKVLNDLRNIGIKVSLDDFGTGYSSLSYLKKIPLDSIKIDRSFLLDVLHDSVADAILRSIIGLARNLKLSVTAEGVETIEQLSILEEYGCDRLQGFYFSKPVPPESIDEYLDSGKDFM